MAHISIVGGIKLDSLTLPTIETAFNMYADCLLAEDQMTKKAMSSSLTPMPAPLASRAGPGPSWVQFWGWSRFSRRHILPDRGLTWLAA